VLSWSYRQLSPDAARLFRLLGLHPGPDLTAAAVASLVALPPSRTPALLAELIRTNLVGQPVPGRYAFHGLLRTYAWELTEHTETARQRRSAIRRLLDHYTHTADAANRLLGPTCDDAPPGPVEPGVTPEPLSDQAHALAWFMAERRVLFAAVALAARYDLQGPSRRLASALAAFSAKQGDWYADSVAS
jgi:hypothetical protein